MKQTRKWCNRPPMWITVHNPSGKKHSYHIQNNYMKGKMLHPPSDILPMMNLIPVKQAIILFNLEKKKN